MLVLTFNIHMFLRLLKFSNFSSKYVHKPKISQKYARKENVINFNILEYSTQKITQYDYVKYLCLINKPVITFIFFLLNYELYYVL